MNMVEYCLCSEKVPVSLKHNNILYKAGFKQGYALSGANFEYFDKGRCSYIYKYLSKDNVLLKVYNYDFNDRYRLSKGIFEYLKKADLPSVVDLYEYFYLTGSYILQFLGGIDAFSMQEITGDRVQFINYDRRQLIEIMKNLEQTLIALSKKKIILRDMHAGNIVLTDNGLTIIDCDQFMPSSSSEKICYLENKKNTLDCINSIICSEFGSNVPTVFENTPYCSLYDSFKSYISNFDENTIGEHLENVKCKK